MAQSVAISDDGSVAMPLRYKIHNQGLLPPRMTAVQRVFKVQLQDYRSGVVMIATEVKHKF
jgi:hypothetical protein